MTEQGPSPVDKGTVGEQRQGSGTGGGTPAAQSVAESFTAADIDGPHATPTGLFLLVMTDHFPPFKTTQKRYATLDDAATVGFNYLGGYSYIYEITVADPHDVLALPVDMDALFKRWWKKAGDMGGTGE